MSKSAKQFRVLLERKENAVIEASIPFGRGATQTFAGYLKSMRAKEKLGVPAMCAEGLIQYEKMEKTINHLASKNKDVYNLQKAVDEILNYCVENIRS